MRLRFFGKLLKQYEASDTCRLRPHIPRHQSGQDGVELSVLRRPVELVFMHMETSTARRSAEARRIALHFSNCAGYA